MENAYIYTGDVMHKRTKPVSHKFNYPIYFYAFNLDKLEELSESLTLFSYNKKNITAIFDKDYLDENSDKTIKEKLLSYLESRVNTKNIDSVYLITSARYFNYVFNPVSFYYCFNDKKEVLAIVAEVNNTFGEKHLYILDESSKALQKNNKFLAHYTMEKDFHVSPFFNIEGDYDFWFSKIFPELEIKINILENEKPHFFATQQGIAKKLTNLAHAVTILKYPITASLSMPRILFEAYRLKFLRRLKVYKRPYARSVCTIKKAKIKKRQAFGMNKICNILQGAKNGVLTLELPDCTIIRFGKPSDKYGAHIKVSDYDFFWELVKGGPVALGETYTKGYFNSPNLTALIEWCLVNRETIESKSFGLLSAISKIKNFITHNLNRNSIKGSKKNISAHYDLSNDFFKLFLDTTLSYSAAYFKHDKETLENAQINKIDNLIDKLNLDSSKHLLEIGTGWGALSVRAATKYGCKVTSITISKEQYKHAKALVKSKGLQDLINIKFCDFRNLTGEFDALVSVEMLEAIGVKNYEPFFKVCNKVLKPNALIALQVITIGDARFEGLKKRCDWIQKYIFPGSLIPSLNALSTAASKVSDFSFEEMQNIGPHYGRTLKLWKESFNKELYNVRKLGFDSEFINTWNYYLSYCEAAFNTRTLGTHQILMTRSVNSVLSGIKSLPNVSSTNKVKKLRK